MLAATSRTLQKDELADLRTYGRESSEHQREQQRELGLYHDQAARRSWPSSTSTSAAASRTRRTSASGNTATTASGDAGRDAGQGSADRLDSDGAAELPVAQERLHLL